MLIHKIFIYCLLASKSFFIQNLNRLAALVRGELPKLTRNILGALITIDVHARDIVTGMVEKKVMYLVLDLIVHAAQEGKYIMDSRKRSKKYCKLLVFSVDHWHCERAQETEVVFLFPLCAHVGTILEL